ncbi:Dynein light chain 1, cytoplasmic [Toxocara canis]|uniref:Dynein light chain 1, cytoplasmic n=1 Tax=Toxocara canis TaxID=6265 RepID=A0A0B2VDE0_TOXCA|nr:Dynein light chain 1, cytoplasmic [Toxocara canis]
MTETKAHEEVEVDGIECPVGNKGSSSEMFIDGKSRDPKVLLVASGMDDEMEALAIKLAIEAIAMFPNEKMRIAKRIASRFEAKYGASWHCIVSDGHMRFYVRYNVDDHIYFAVGQMSIFLFRLYTPKPQPLINRLFRRLSDASVKVDSRRDDVRIMSTGMNLIMQHYAIRLSDDAIAKFPNEKMIIAYCITTRFEAQYGGNWHCVVSDDPLGYEVRYDKEDHIFLSVGQLTILLFREGNARNALAKSSLTMQRKPSTSMQFPTKIISSGMDMEKQQFAVGVIVKGIEMKLANKKMQIAHLLMCQFEERFDAPWHCIVGDQPLAFYARYDQQNYIYLRVEQLAIFLFQHAKHILPSEESVDESNECKTTEDERNGSVEVQMIAGEMEETMKEKAKCVAEQAITRFATQAMLTAHYIMTRMEAEYGPSWHCVVSDASLGYSVHESERRSCYFRINSMHIFLFST